MTRLIDADKIDFRGIWGSTAIRRQAEKVVESQPTADAAKVVHGVWTYGKWERGHWVIGNERCRCSVCDRTFPVDNLNVWNYCPHCGAEMSGGI